MEDLFSLESAQYVIVDATWWARLAKRGSSNRAPATLSCATRAP